MKDIIKQEIERLQRVNEELEIALPMCLQGSYKDVCYVANQIAENSRNIVWFAKEFEEISKLLAERDR